MRRFLKFITALVLIVFVASSSFSAARAQGGTYVVQPGDTLFSIAARFNVSVSELATINGLYDVNAVFVGQVLRLPAPLPGGYNPPVVQPPVVSPVVQPPVVTYPPGTTVTTVTTYTSYTVRPGDTLSKIAANFKTTVNAIMSANRITNPNLLYVGQRLTIPRTTTTIRPVPRSVVYPVRSGRIYIVQPGDNLFGIAARFRRDVYAIARANGILNLNAIYVGQALIIP